MSRIQIGLSPGLSDDLRAFMEARDLAGRWAAVRGDAGRATSGCSSRRSRTARPASRWASTPRRWPRAGTSAAPSRTSIALASHQNAAAGWDARLLRRPGAAAGRGRPRQHGPRGFRVEKLGRLKPAFDRTSGQGTLTAGNSSPLTDGAAAIWVATAQGLERLPAETPRVRLVDYEVNAIDLFNEYLLMAPAYAIPRLLARNGLTYDDIAPVGTARGLRRPGGDATSRRCRTPSS